MDDDFAGELPPEVRDALQRMRGKAVLMQASVQQLQHQAATNPDREWPEVLDELTTISKQLEALKGEVSPYLKYFSIVPAVIPPDPTELTMMLSTMELPAMEAERAKELRRQGPQPPDDEAAIKRHNDMIDQLEAVFAEVLDGRRPDEDDEMEDAPPPPEP